jgi:hypothetical protein
MARVLPQLNLPVLNFSEALQIKIRFNGYSKIRLATEGK